jgi:hypothetical protein
MLANVTMATTGDVSRDSPRDYAWDWRGPKVDVVYFWTWNANHLVDLEKNFKAFRDICPDVRVRLGVYMWNFNNKAVVPMELMKHHLDCAYRWLRSDEVEGLIFHCTPLCDMGLEAVVYSRRWIDEHGEEPVGCDELAPIHD